MGLNLHKIVRGTINAVNRDIPCELYRSTGRFERDMDGEVTAVYESPVSVKCQFQSLSANDIRQFEALETMTITRRIYLYASGDPSKRPWAQWRPLGRAGDIIKDHQSNLWTVGSVIEDFSNEGWVCLMCTLQPTGTPMIVEGDTCDDAC